MSMVNDAIPQKVKSWPVAWRLIIAATIFTGATIALVWFIAVPLGPSVCAAIYPPARNCFWSDRLEKGLVVSVAVVVIYIATVTLALMKNRRHHKLVVSGVALLAVAPILSYLAIAWIPAFASSLL